MSVDVRPVARPRGSARVHRAPVPAALYRAALGPPAAPRAPAVPRPPPERLLQARRGRALPAPGATGAWSAASAPRSTTRFNEFQDNALGDVRLPRARGRPRGRSRALLDAAEGWLRERGRDRMVGPMDFRMNDESGVLIEGFDREPMIRQPWHPPYYQALLRGGRAREGDGPASCGSSRSPTARRSCRSICELAEQAASPKHGDRDPQDDAPRPARATSTSSPRSTTRPGRTTGASSPLLEGGPRRLRPGPAARLRPRTGSWSPSKDGETVGDGDHACRTSTRC